MPPAMLPAMCARTAASATAQTALRGRNLKELRRYDLLLTEY